MYLDNDRRPTLTPQLAVRVAIIGGIALVAFAVVFFRLWYLQVLSGDKYRAEANNNRIREIKVQAPRGEIVDREGRTLVDNRVGLAVKVTPNRLPKEVAGRRQVYRRLGRALELKPRRIAREVNTQLKAQPFSTATVKTDVSLATVSYVLEHQDDFPGVTVERVFLRQYPHRELGAHLFGTVGEVTQEQLDRTSATAAWTIGDRIGQSGIEYEYDRFLRGRNGASRVQVDALGNLNRELSVEQPEQGRQLRLSIDLDVQRAGQQALAGGTGRGAFVVMNVNDGQIVALGSHPSFDPNIFSKVIRQRDLDRLNDEENGAPLSNRATQGLYPTGSTFKLITATAALEGGLITPDTTLFDGGSLEVGGVTFKNAGDVSHGALALRQALTVSSDVFFYRLGLEANGAGNGLLIQDWARRLGLGRKTGIDLPGENPGPGADAPLAQPALQEEAHRAALDAGRQHQPLGRPGRPAGRPAADGGRLRGDRATAAGCSCRGSASGSRTPAAGRSRSCRRRPHGGSARSRSSGRRSSTACAVRPATRAAPRPRSSRASRSRSPARPARRRRAAAPTSPGTSRSRPIPAPSTWSR